MFYYRIYSSNLCYYTLYNIYLPLPLVSVRRRILLPVILTKKMVKSRLHVGPPSVVDR